MSRKQADKLRPRWVEHEECPICGSKEGSPCVSIVTGRKVQPHKLANAKKIPRPKFVPVPVATGVQLLLFEVPPPLTQDETPA